MTCDLPKNSSIRDMIPFYHPLLNSFRTPNFPFLPAERALRDGTPILTDSVRLYLIYISTKVSLKAKLSILIASTCVRGGITGNCCVSLYILDRSDTAEAVDNVGYGEPILNRGCNWGYWDTLCTGSSESWTSS